MKSRSYFRELASDLVSKMTIEECASQLLHNSPKIERLNIKEYNWWNEALHGVARNGIATVFPQAIAMGASFDDKFLYKEATVISTEARAKFNIAREFGTSDIYKNLTFWSPNINIFRDPRWGRGQETYGEDPYLTSRMGVAFIKGLEQRDKSDNLKVSACAKHFAVHSGPEKLRHSFNAKVSQKDLRETYLYAFEKCVKDGHVESVMGAYNAVNGKPACANDDLLVKILRDEWGFDGHVVSDCWAVKDIYNGHKYVKTPEEAACVAVINGCDINCGCTYERLIDGLKLGLIKEEDIRESAIRIFTTRFSLGIEQGQSTVYDNLSVESINTPKNRKMAKTAALKSTVLLKNDGILPLNKKEIRKIAVIGPNAYSENALSANYNGESDKYVTNLDGIRNKCSLYGITVYYSKGCDIAKEKEASMTRPGKYYSEAFKIAKESDVVILCLGLDNTFEGEEGEAVNSQMYGDKLDLSIPVSQKKLFDLIKETGKPIIVNVNTGSPVDMEEYEKYSNAMILSWYNGEEAGSALSDILFGEYNPAGRLPITFYHNTDPIPDFEDYSMKDRTYKYISYKPWHEFGYGLSYTHFSYSLLSYETTLRTIKIKFKIKNDGKYDGDEVYQVYSSYNGNVKNKPNCSLIDFDRVFIKKGESKVISLNIPLDSIKLYNYRGTKTLYKGEYNIYIGCSSDIKSSPIMVKYVK